jgi:hypothetical protein
MLDALLSRPTRTVRTRMQALIYLAAVLTRFHQFPTATALYDYLIGSQMLDPQTCHGLRLGRAMSLLREDRLVDADQAISELRRAPGAADSGGLALIEIYRDVKTGHPQHAIDIFSAKRDVMRAQLAHRLSDACALIARAYDLLSNHAQAAAHYHDATLLSPQVELSRRYPEIACLAGRYPAALRPPELP